MCSTGMYKKIKQAKKGMFLFPNQCSPLPTVLELRQYENDPASFEIPAALFTCTVRKKRGNYKTCRFWGSVESFLYCFSSSETSGLPDIFLQIGTLIFKNVKQTVSFQKDQHLETLNLQIGARRTFGFLHFH